MPVPIDLFIYTYKERAVKEQTLLKKRVVESLEYKLGGSA